MTEMALKSGKVMNMLQLQAAFDTILQENNVKGKTCSCKTIKKLIKAEVGVEFHKSKCVNESEWVSITESRDLAIQLSETVDEDCTSNMKTLYDAAVLLRSPLTNVKSGHSLAHWKHYKGQLPQGTVMLLQMDNPRTKRYPVCSRKKH